MNQEIERKFLVEDPAALLALATERRTILQGYLSTAARATVRVRVLERDGESRAMLTIKGMPDPSGEGLTRPEYEYAIPTADARAMLASMCADHPIEKTRHLVPHQGHVWEVDVFAGANTGLVLAEIELSAEDEAFALAPGVGAEVTHDPRYLNSSLASTPFTSPAFGS